MGQLVAQGVPEIIIRQTGVRQDDTGPEKAQQHGGGRQPVFVQLYGAVDAHLPAELPQAVQPGDIRHLRASRPYIPAEALIDRDLPQQQERRRAQPYGPEILPERPANFPRGGAFVLRRQDHIPRWDRWQRNRVRRRDGHSGADGLPEDRPHQAHLRRQRQQQPGNDNQPDVILPPAAEPALQQRPGQQQEQDQQGAGGGQRNKHPKYAIHCPLPSQNRFSSA